MKTLCDFSQIEGKLARYKAAATHTRGHGSRRKPGAWAAIHEVIMWVGKNDWHDDIQAQWRATVVFKSILQSEAMAALAEAQHAIEAAKEFDRMRRQA